MALFFNKYFGRTRRGRLNADLGHLAKLLTKDNQPNVNNLTALVRELDVIKLNLKVYGYDLARVAAARLPVRETTSAQRVGLASKACTQTDMETEWAAHWLAELKVPVVFHRKLWEFAYLLQALFENGMIAPGKRGVGFGCGNEPIPSYLTSKGVNVTITDLPSEDGRAEAWARYNDLATSKAGAYRAHLVDWKTFDANSSILQVDMNDIPRSLTGYDFCWSVCALEHLGSIEAGLTFIERSLDTLKPGGIAVHTTEFNYANDTETIDNWMTVLFQKKHFIALHERMTALGHTMAPLDFAIGDKPMDQFIDLPPYIHDWTDPMIAAWGNQHNALKLSIDGFPCTCFGIIVRKAG